MAPETGKKSVFRAGAYVYVEGDEDSNDIFIVEKGEVGLHGNNDRIKLHKPLVRQGEVFGFTSTLCKRPRMESAIARRDSLIITLKRERFIELVQNNPKVAIKILNYFANELRTYNEMMLSLDPQDDDFIEDETRLFDLARHYRLSGRHDYARHILESCAEQYPGGAHSGEIRSLLAEMRGPDASPSAGLIENGSSGIFRDGQMIFAEFEKGDDLFIIKEGRVKIIKVGGGQEVLLSVLKGGDIFGELAIISNKPRNATAISMGTTTLLSIKKENFAEVLAKSSAIASKIFMAISQRIWFTYIRLESKVYAQPITRIYAFLENKLLEDRVSLKSTGSVTLTFGIDELLRMSGIPVAQSEKAMGTLLDDPNLEFNFGQVSIENPSVLSTKAKFYRSRDHISSWDGDSPSRKEQHRSAAPARRAGAGADPDEGGPPARPAGPLDETGPMDGIERTEPAVRDDAGLKLPSEEINFD
ncbi:MAG TPA: cyclic nucleotide-binding domain-containing protein [Spirochaetota bacterium]|nr:cyclic nucleotide-binding domain-containing protein [Spirochaetota bacterium]